jgi:putative colanic acid biosynthesis acetyltransferase WcaF
MVLGGVTIKSHALLAAGSVATKSLNAWTIYRGNPAVAVRARMMAESTVMAPGNTAEPA